jgi:predicted ATP-grasp superfamily ATP-dependent carboligase
MAINKAGLSQFLEQNNIPKPRTVLLNDQVALDKLIQEFGFPLVIKKSRGSAGRMMQLIQDSQALSECLKSLDLNGFLAQPFIIGSDITCNVICREGEVICSTIQESPVKYGANFSSNDILEFKRDETVLNLVSRLMKGLRWNGVACIDMRRDQRDGKVYVLEINGRFWASVLSSYTKAGLNFPLILYKLATGSEDFQIPSPKPAHQISFKQYVQQKFRGKKVKFRDTKFITYLADPYARLNQILENKLFKHSSRLTEEEIS